MHNDIITGLKYTTNNEYQKFIHKKANDFLGNQDKISVDALMNNSLFSSLNQVNDKNMEKSLKEKISNIAGDGYLNKEELKTVLILMDAELKNNKFNMDAKFNIATNSGIFQATPNEINALKNTAAFFDYDNQELNAFPTLKNDNTMIFHDRDGNLVETIQLDKLQ